MTYFFDKREYFKWARSQFQIDWRGFHGAPHWARVYNIGQHLAEKEGARADVCELFAFLHDHRRWHEGFDSTHGPMAVDSAKYLRDRFFSIDDAGFDDLCVAMSLHSDGELKHNITVECCWDSDRLDLWRVGIMPDPRYLCTKTARDPVYIEKCALASQTWFDSYNAL